jgi:raffinose/stachyose/melibiose transport system substrate-binding protein
MKKVLAILALVCMSMTLMAQGQKDETAAPERQTLSMFEYIGETATEAFTMMGEAFESENPQIDFTLETIKTEYNTVLKAKDAAGKLPDIFQASSPGEPALTPYLNAGKLQPITDFAAIRRLSSDMQDSLRFSDGEIYIFPMTTTARGLIYNTEIFKEIGYDSFPNTLDGLAEACVKLQAAGYIPFASGAADGWTVGSLVYQCGHEIFASKDFASRMTAGTASHKEIKEIFGFIDLFRDNSQKNYMSSDYSNSISLYAQQKAAMIVQGPWATDAIAELAPEVVDISRMTGIPYTNDASRNKLYLDYNGYFVVSSTADTQVADDFLDFVVAGSGREIFASTLKQINPFGISFEANAVFQSIFEEVNADNAFSEIQYMNAPDGWWQNQALIMQEYLMGALTQDQMLQRLDAEWASLASAQ